MSEVVQLLRYARRALEQGQIKTAECAVQAVLDREPDNKPALYFMELITEAKFSAQRRREEIERGSPLFIYPTMPPRLRGGDRSPAQQFAPHEPPPCVSVPDEPRFRTLDSVPTTDSGGGR